MPKFFIFILICTCLQIFNAAPVAAQNSDVMMQAFNWNSSANVSGWYNIVNANVAEMKAGGINTIWLPPCGKSAAREGYLPSEYYNLTSPYGTQAQLQTLIGNLHTNNMKALADIVINHRVGTTNWADFTNPTWGCWAVCNNDEWAGRCGNNDTGASYGPARDIDHTNPQVQADIAAWLNWLKNTIGFDGWRYDYVLGFGGNYVGQYNTASQPYFSVGENWTTDKQQIQNWIDATNPTYAQRSAAFDFPTKGILQNALNANNYSSLNNGGAAPGMIGWSPAKSVTFLDNHDTGSSQNHWPFPGGKVMQGYAYILTHPGIPMVFWDHYFDWGLKAPINALIKVRKDNNLSATSVLNIQTAQSNVYAAIIDNKVAMKIGPGNWSPPGTGWTLKASGTDYAVWDKAAAVVTAPTLTVSPNGQTTAFTSNAAIPVSVTATDNSGAAVNIYYTLDGTMPTAASTMAVAPLSLTISVTKNLRLFAKGSTSNLSSAMQSHNYIVNQPPTLSALPAAPYSSATAYNVVLTATTGSTIYYTLDGSTPTIASLSRATPLTLTIAATKTVKAFAKSTAGVSSAVQSFVYTIAPNPVPVLTVSPAGPYSTTSTFNATLTAAACTIYYTLDGTTPTTASMSGASPVTLTIAASKTVKAFAKDAWGALTAVQTHVYTIAPLPGFTVYFKKPTTWTAPWIHYWGALPANSLADCVWPCQAMTAHTVTDWYKKRFTNISSTNLLFHNNGGAALLKTADLTRSSEGSFEGTTWTNGAPSSNGVINFVMDGVLDAAATPLVTNNGVTIYTAFSGGKMYIATQSGQSYANKDVFVYVSANPNGGVAVPWGKTGQVANGCKVLVNEGSNTYAAWSGATTTAVAKAGAAIVEGQITVATEFPGATQLYVSVGVYGTNNLGVLEKQCPAAVTANNNIEPNEFRAIPVPAMRLAPDATDATLSSERLSHKEGGETVSGVTLYQNTPNPFDAQTAITFDIIEAQNVALSIFDANGRLIELLQKGTLAAGRHQFIYDASSLPKGVYCYILETNGERIVKKMIVM